MPTVVNPTRRFTRRADYYARFRPGYPRGIIGILAREIEFDDKDVVADIGSGTGLLSKPFLENGNTVFAVEPNDRMRFHAERDFVASKNFISVKGTAERTTLRKGSIDLIIIGQALHWFNPEKSVKEFTRISKPGARLCVVYNNRKNDRLGRAYGKVVKRYERERAKVPDINTKYISRFFLSGKYSRFVVPNEQVLDFDGLLGRFLSASYMPTSKEKDLPSFKRDVRALFDSYNIDGHLRLHYDTEIFIGKTRP